MSQNRKAPAYQEYAADILAQLPFRTISLQDRGLLWTMCMECWVNKQLPNNPEVIARALGLPLDEVVFSLPSVMSFFNIVDDFIVCPELENYRAYIESRKQKQSQGGINSASKKAKDKRKKAIKSISNVISSNLKVPCKNLESNMQAACKSRVESSTVEQSQVQLSREEQSLSLDKEVLKDPFVSEMEEYEVNEGLNDKKRFMRI